MGLGLRVFVIAHCHFTIVVVGSLPSAPLCVNVAVFLRRANQRQHRVVRRVASRNATIAEPLLCLRCHRATALFFFTKRSIVKLVVIRSLSPNVKVFFLIYLLIFNPR